MSKELTEQPTVRHAIDQPRWGLIAAACCGLVGMELFVLLMLPSWGHDALTFVYGLLGVLGFWLACGRARWWSRCIVTAALVCGLIFFEADLHIVGVFIFGALTLIFAGISFALRAAISLINRGSNRHHSISIQGIMRVILGAGLVFLFLRLMQAFDSTWDVHGMTIFMIHVTLLGFSYQMHCAAVWFYGRAFWRWWGVAILTAVVSMFVSFGTEQMMSGDPRLRIWLEAYGIGITAIWLTAYPLDFILRRLGWSLAQPSWYLDPSIASSVQMSSDGGRSEGRETAAETVDFDDIN